jgi:hypothetical protein
MSAYDPKRTSLKRRRLQSKRRQKRTFRGAIAMSALPPNADIKTAVRDLSNLMSALVPKMSALTPIADIHPLFGNVRFGPKADMVQIC